MTTQNPIAVADTISKRFYATQALEDVSLKFNAGEVHALIGENGAGKRVFQLEAVLMASSRTVFTKRVQKTKRLNEFFTKLLKLLKNNNYEKS